MTSENVSSYRSPQAAILLEVRRPEAEVNFNHRKRGDEQDVHEAAATPEEAREIRV